MLDVARLRTAVGELDDGVATVVVTSERLAPDALDRLLAHARPLATGRAGVDAVKRVAAGRIIETLDRQTLYIASLPIVTDRAVLVAVLAAAATERCAIADLVDPGRLPIALVDTSGELIGSVET